MYLVNRRVRRSACFYTEERARKILELMQTKHGARNCILYGDCEGAMSLKTMNQSPQVAKLASGAMVLAVENQPRPAVLFRKSVVEGWQCLCGDEVKSGDLVPVAFGGTKVHSGGGLYIVEAGANDGDNWRDCRRMMLVPQGIAIDIDCEGDWRTFPTVDASGMRAVGTVETVCRPTKYQ